MPGGSEDAYRAVEDVLRKIAAQTSDGPCVTFCGAGGAGHFVKMVHNGMEYGDSARARHMRMPHPSQAADTHRLHAFCTAVQLIAEVHDALRCLLPDMSAADEAALFESWNAPGNMLASYLLEITAQILRTPDERDASGKTMLLDRVEDITSQKGTGKWTVEQAADLGVAIPSLGAGLEARYVSSDKPLRARIAERMAAAGVAPKPALSREALALLGVSDAAAARCALTECLAATLFCCKLVICAQGFALMRAKAVQRGWGHNAAELARTWQGGCIIRAVLLKDVRRAFIADTELANLLLDEQLAQQLAARLPAWRTGAAAGALSGVAMPTTSASLAYFDSMRRERGPAALAAAQRDFFGSHGYQRTDAKGQFHTEHWGAKA